MHVSFISGLSDSNTSLTSLVFTGDGYLFLPRKLYACFVFYDIKNKLLVARSALEGMSNQYTNLKNVSKQNSVKKGYCEFSDHLEGKTVWD